MAKGQRKKARVTEEEDDLTCSGLNARRIYNVMWAVLRHCLAWAWPTWLGKARYDSTDGDNALHDNNDDTNNGDEFLFSTLPHVHSRYKLPANT